VGVRVGFNRGACRAGAITTLPTRTQVLAVREAVTAGWRQWEPGVRTACGLQLAAHQRLHQR
jgi:hypothetical protein